MPIFIVFKEFLVLPLYSQSRFVSDLVAFFLMVAVCDCLSKSIVADVDMYKSLT